ncbi:histidine acid phosphatase [Coniochaeta ligniaria NRRL 30616]|uniref:3-phytase n=1 Tax=Coniochaeta ligniaria NRRL 30616 TaxID=1408157 RepID=A0A1J7IPW2_9PEZI|nr:histidine acid phosphatase [Coniochaeta ligniaria NRRL 30616]
MSLSKALHASLALAGQATAVQFLAPNQDINLPASESATSPLQWLGANSPWSAGPNVYNISPDVPEGCVVDQAAYILRHGSRYPDNGAYQGWVAMQARFNPDNGYTASGSLSFLPSWKTVLTNPSLQIAMESPTGYKEAYDLGYTLRTRYPNLYTEGDPFPVWANNYTRVLQTAQNFVRGYLGTNAATLGSVIAVTSKGFPAALADTLAPSDMCPLFADDEGTAYVSKWNAIYLPPIQARLQALVAGNLTLTASDVAQIPYLCGFESQITGRLSPWCGVFTDEELRGYEYANDLRYYYGVGSGTKLQQTMMTPFLDALVKILVQGPGGKGKAADGGEFAVPSLLMSFLNDGQLIELLSATGLFDGQTPLDPEDMDDGRLWHGSRFVTMRGTLALERLTCSSAGGATAPTATTTANATATKTKTCKPRPTSTGGKETYVRLRLNDAVYKLPGCSGGPGSSCPLGKYADYVSQKLAAQGSFVENCNVTVAGAPTTVKGASFFTDLSSPWLQAVKP